MARPKPTPAGIAAHSVSHQSAATLNDSFSKKLKLQVACRPRPGPNQVFSLAFGSIMYGASRGSGLACATKGVLRSRSPVRMRFLTATVVATAIALAGCTSDGTPTSTGDLGSIGSFVHNLFGSNSEDQPPVAHNEAPVEPSVPKSTTSKPKHAAVARAAAARAKLRSRRPTTKTVAQVPKEQASAEPQSPPESATPPLLGGAARTLPAGSFDNPVGSRR